MPRNRVPSNLAALNLKVPTQVRESLEAAALISGRSLTAEASYRLMRSFEIDEFRDTVREEIGIALSGLSLKVSAAA